MFLLTSWPSIHAFSGSSDSSLTRCAMKALGGPGSRQRSARRAPSRPRSSTGVTLGRREVWFTGRRSRAETTHLTKNWRQMVRKDVELEKNMNFRSEMWFLEQEMLNLNGHSLAHCWLRFNNKTKCLLFGGNRQWTTEWTSWHGTRLNPWTKLLTLIPPGLWVFFQFVQNFIAIDDKVPASLLLRQQSHWFFSGRWKSNWSWPQGKNDPFQAVFKVPCCLTSVRTEEQEVVWEPPEWLRQPSTTKGREQTDSERIRKLKFGNWGRKFGPSFWIKNSVPVTIENGTEHVCAS